MSEETNTNNQNAENQNAGNENNEQKDTFTFTQEQLDALIQREGDKRVSQAMKSVERKQKEADKLKNMSDTERYEYQLQQREEAIAAKEKELALTENKAVASSILIEKGLSAKLVDFVVAEDADTMNNNIKLLDKEFKAMVKAEVEKRLGGNAPHKQQQDTETLTKEKFRKMSLMEQQNLFNTDRELYNSLIK